MRKKAFYRLIAFVLLFAIQWSILPFYQVFHKHHTAVSIKKSGQTELKKYEEPCCQSFEVTLNACLPTFFQYTFEQPIVATYQDYTDPEFHNLFIHFSNKAPPVKTV